MWWDGRGVCVPERKAWVWVSIKNVQPSQAWPSCWPQMVCKLWKLWIQPVVGLFLCLGALCSSPCLWWVNGIDWHETFYFPLSRWSNTGTGCTEGPLSLKILRGLQPRPWAPAFVGPAVSSRLRRRDLQRALPASGVQWFCDTQELRGLGHPPRKIMQVCLTHPKITPSEGVAVQEEYISSDKEDRVNC